MENTIKSNNKAIHAEDSSGLLEPILRTIQENRIYVVIGILAIVIFSLVPPIIGVDSFYIYFLFMIFLYIAVSQGWNLIGGFTGQLSLGTHAFFALGGYTTALIWIHDITHTWYYFDPLVMFLSGVVPAIFAVLIGIPTLSRLRGDYFAFGTLAAAEVLKVVILRTQKFSGGQAGLSVKGEGFTDLGIYYYTALGLAVLTVLVLFVITKSRIGVAIRAISEDETSAASHGIYILKYKLIAFCISSFIMGICGSLYFYYQFIVNPSSMMDLTRWMFYPLLICILGGNGTIMGPIIGAFIIYTLFTFAENVMGRIHPMLSGFIIILVMKYLPTGIWGLKEKISRR
jgi:branched-chain amino acid transport system permease protein